MIIKVDTTGTPDGLSSLLEEAAESRSVKGLLVLACDENGFTPDSVDGILRNVSVPLFGGIFPQVIAGREKLARGTIVAGLSSEIDVQVVPGLSDPAVDYDEKIDRLFPETGDARTMFVLVDGYGQRIGDLVDSLFNIFGLEINYLGGGAGSINPTALEMDQGPCLFTNRGLVNDSALLVATSMESGVGVSHGWSKLCGPFKVTESEGNTIKTLDWRPAFEVYKHTVDEISGASISRENFFDIAKSYPFGLSRLQSEIIVRDPFTVNEEGSLIVASEVPRESFVDILTGDTDSLIRAAGEAAQNGFSAFEGETDEKTILCFDCISRVLFLGESFGREIEAVAREGVPLIGALSLGEIANSGRDYMELYNKTCVVGVLGK